MIFLKPSSTAASANIQPQNSLRMLQTDTVLHDRMFFEENKLKVNILQI